MNLADLTSADVANRDAGTILAVPLGSTEQHGAHLPLSTDTDIAVELCGRLATARSDVVVAPAVPYGSSGEHAGFAGTLSIGAIALEQVVVELGRSATETFAHLLFVSAHGGNLAAVTAAVKTLRAESRDVSVFSPRWSDDLHAGHAETSMLLALRPEAVQMDLAAAGDTRPWRELESMLRRGGVRAVTPTGVLGDPTSATGMAGAALLERLAADLIATVETWRTRVPV